MTTSSNPICVACGSLNSIVFCNHDCRTIRRCRSCDLLFVFPQPDEASLHEQFQSDYFVKGRLPGQTRLELEFEQWRRPTVASIAERILELKSSGKLLDVGCASGEVFEQFRNGCWQLYGVEPSTLAFKRAAERFGNDASVHLFNAYLSDIDFERNSFDVVTVLESLYYMPDPRRELSRLAQLLKDDGLLAIAVPGYTYQRLLHGSGSSWANSRSCSLTTSHLFYFSESSISKLLESHGLRLFDAIQLGTSVYGSGWRQFSQTSYVGFSKAIAALTLGRIKLAPHVLYLCRKSRNA